MQLWVNCLPRKFTHASPLLLHNNGWTKNWNFWFNSSTSQLPLNAEYSIIIGDLARNLSFQKTVSDLITTLRDQRVQCHLVLRNPWIGSPYQDVAEVRLPEGVQHVQDTSSTSVVYWKFRWYKTMEMPPAMTWAPSGIPMCQSFLKIRLEKRIFSASICWPWILGPTFDENSLMKTLNKSLDLFFHESFKRINFIRRWTNFDQNFISQLYPPNSQSFLEKEISNIPSKYS